MIKRIGIYLTYDRQRIIDGYIGYMLKELKTCVDYLVVICNEISIASGIEFLQQYADEIYYRDNIGLDAGGFKDALTRFLGWDKVLCYDELVLVNDSLFGPFCPMKTIFDEMGKRTVDFWGLAGHGEYRERDMDYFPEHIQSFFIVIRQGMLHSDQFRTYWDEMPYYASYNQVVREHEMQFTRRFFSLGYTYDFYANIKANNSLNPANNYCQFAAISYELIKKYNFPFLKKQQIAGDKLAGQTQEELHQALRYIDQETDYDINLIWKNIIRTLDISDLQRNLHFQYTVPDKSTGAGHKDRVAVVVCISHEKSAEAVLEYLERITADIKIIAEHKGLLSDYDNRGLDCRIVPKENMAEFLQGFCEYDLVCMLNDVDMTSRLRPNYIGKSYFFNIWENLLKSDDHVAGVQELFEAQPYLGLLTNPQPNFARYFRELGKGWDGHFDEVREMVKKKGLGSPVSEDKPPFRTPGNLWVRGAVLKRLKSWTAEELELLPYLWIYIAQDAGYYSGIVESLDYSAMNETNLQCYLNEITELVRDQYGDFGDLIEMKKKLSRSYLSDFCERYSRILVYGTGILARKYRAVLPRPQAYIVSDGQVKLEELDGVPVRYLSEIEVDDDCGIVLCLNRKNQAQVAGQLKKMGIRNYIGV